MFDINGMLRGEEEIVRGDYRLFQENPRTRRQPYPQNWQPVVRSPMLQGFV